MKADLVLLAMGFVHPVAGVLEAFGVERDHRGNAKAPDEGHARTITYGVRDQRGEGFRSRRRMRRGQSLVVWAIREGRQCAPGGRFPLMGSSTLPR